MSWDNIVIDAVLLAVTYVAWRRYGAEILRWLLWVGFILVAASIWQHIIENALFVPEYVQMGSLIAVQVLRLVLISMLALVVIRSMRAKPLSRATEKIIIAVPAVVFFGYVLVRLLA